MRGQYSACVYVLGPVLISVYNTNRFYQFYWHVNSWTKNGDPWTIGSICRPPLTKVVFPVPLSLFRAGIANFAICYFKIWSYHCLWKFMYQNSGSFRDCSHVNCTFVLIISIYWLSLACEILVHMTVKPNLLIPFVVIWSWDQPLQLVLFVGLQSATSLVSDL